ncbi:MAG: class I SAM-dependent methyltransferase [Myxococcales bacterium]|nr:class I SAM-dependent methyltransferase [Myxococcales bacterium]MCB9521477.1 class I SAM-dependent methyltransferase [Myxococcales bacterium]MCB9531759.1 class I SAM-dependent methyltransferase [Myxococcales bacterium]
MLRRTDLLIASAVASAALTTGCGGAPAPTEPAALVEADPVVVDMFSSDEPLPDSLGGSDPAAGGHHGEAGGHHGEAGGHQHGFTDPEAWAARWDNAERDEWQQPERVIAAMEISPGMTVADVGTGTGYFLPHLSAAVGAEGRVLARDVEPAMIDYVQARCEREGLGNVDAQVIGFESPGLPAHGMDRVMLVNTWHHIESREAYAAAVAETLAPNGALYIVEYTRDAQPGPPAEMRLDPEQVITELAAGGLTATVVEPALPRQYVVRAVLATEPTAP